MAARGGRSSTFKIEPFKHPIAMDPNYADKTWRVLESAITEIHNQNASGLSFEELYRNAYNMVLHKFGDRLYSGVAGALRSHLAGVASRIEQTQGLPFLQELVARWADHNKSTQMIRDILMYMDRTYVMQQHKTPVFQLGLDLWREQVVRQRCIHARLLAILGDLVGRERGGELVDRSLLRAVTQMLMDLGRPTYQEDFEAHFLAAAADFYRAEAQAWIGACSAPEYLEKAERRLDEEVERVRSYLDESTEPKITRVAETQLIQEQMRTLAEMPESGLLPLLAADRHADLGRMYGLFKRVEGGADLLRGMMGRHVEEAGRRVVNDADMLKDPVAFVNALLAMRDKYEATISRAFGDDKAFKNTLNASFEAFLNAQQRSPEFISLFVDKQLGGSGARLAGAAASEAELDALLDRVMGLFRYLHDKDVFERYYKNHLSKRLLSSKGLSEDLERTMLVKLKTECGYQFTSKLESMFTDIRTSRDAMEGFLAHVAAGGIQLPFDVYVSVLTTGSWPEKAASPCVLPAEMASVAAAFQDYYTTSHGGRKLTWQASMGTAEVRFVTDKAYSLTVSTHQAAVLLLFNQAGSSAAAAAAGSSGQAGSSSAAAAAAAAAASSSGQAGGAAAAAAAGGVQGVTLTYREISQATEIPAPDLKRALQSLALIRGKSVLRKAPQSKEIEPDDSFSINEGFASKNVRVKMVTISAQQERGEEKAETRQKVEGDRNNLIDAAVVRLMKARRRAEHNDLVAEVIRQLSDHFVANPMAVKKRIETLIEREYMERDSGDRRTYVYLA